MIHCYCFPPYSYQDQVIHLPIPIYCCLIDLGLALFMTLHTILHLLFFLHRYLFYKLINSKYFARMLNILSSFV